MKEMLGKVSNQKFFFLNFPLQPFVFRRLWLVGWGSRCIWRKTAESRWGNYWE